MQSEPTLGLLPAFSASTSMTALYRAVMLRFCLMALPASGPGEKQAPPNLSLRQAAFTAINEIRALIDKECGRVVSCADVLALAARDSVVLSDGPTYKVPLGRRDGLNFATQQATSDNLPRPSATVSEMLPVLTKLGLNLEDLVALSGAHTIGIGHWSSFADRLYSSQASNMNDWFANQLRQTCPEGNTWNTQPIDHRSPNTFDNKYYIDLRNREGLFTSDQDLYTDSRTQGYVNNFANSPDLFFRKFVYSMVKMGQLGVLTGDSGEIGANCSARNPSSIDIQQIVVDVEGDSQVY